MSELEMRKQQMYEGLHNFVTRGIPDEYMDLVERNLKRFCIMMVKYKVEINAKEESYIFQIDYYNKEYSRLDVETRLKIFGKDEHWNNVLETLRLLIFIYDRNKEKKIFKKVRFSSEQCKKYLSYILEEENSCPYYLKNEILVEVQLIWEYLSCMTTIPGYLYCIYMWYKVPKGRDRVPAQRKPGYKEKYKKGVVY